ncbi:MAG TPA: hypothetical protein VL551_06075 [Actinospica sp.]|nr:hypothetical protein [Actinospica sp.]
MKLRVFARRRGAVPRDPAAEIDDELRRLAADLEQCRARREHAMVARLLRTIDERLEARAHLLAPDDGPDKQRAVRPPTLGQQARDQEAGSRA